MQQTLNVVRILSVAVLVGACAAQPDDFSDSQVQAQWSTGARSPSAAPFGCKGDRIALETANGRNYLTAVVGGGFAIIANAGSVGRNETFRAYNLGADRVALQVANGQFIVAENGGGLLLNANANSINSNTTFRLAPTPDGAWLTLRSASGHYVTAEGGGGGVANVAWPVRGANQGFKAVCLQGDLDGSGGSDPGDVWGETPEVPDDAWGDPGRTPDEPGGSWGETGSTWGNPGDAWGKPGNTSGQSGLGG